MMPTSLVPKLVTLRIPVLFAAIEVGALPPIKTHPAGKDNVRETVSPTIRITWPRPAAILDDGLKAALPVRVSVRRPEDAKFTEGVAL